MLLGERLGRRVSRVYARWSLGTKWRSLILKHMVPGIDIPLKKAVDGDSD